MIKTLLTILFAVTTHALWTANAFAATNSQSVLKKFTGIDYSGVYSCVGTNEKIGNYELSVTILINKSHSHGNLGQYDLHIETENANTYSGQAIANGFNMALTIEIVDANTTTYSTGIAHIKQSKNKRFSYINRYYESNQITHPLGANDTGNYGSENCVQQKIKKSPS